MSVMVSDSSSFWGCQVSVVGGITAPGSGFDHFQVLFVVLNLDKPWEKRPSGAERWTGRAMRQVREADADSQSRHRLWSPAAIFLLILSR